MNTDSDNDQDFTRKYSNRELIMRLIKYAANYKGYIVFTLAMILLATAVELWRPVLVGDSIDRFINGYANPYYVLDVESSTGSGDSAAKPSQYPTDAFLFEGVYLTKNAADLSAAPDIKTTGELYQLVLYNDSYYLFKGLRAEADDCQTLKYVAEEQQQDISVSGDSITITHEASSFSKTGTRQTSEQLKVLRKSDYNGVLKNAMLILVTLLLALAFNFLQTWYLQLMGQKIIYDMRMMVFEHVHKLSLRFFDITPVGKIVTRVTNDTETVNEMYTGILVKLIKNVIMITGLMAVMLSLNLRLALYSFALLPIIIIVTIAASVVSRRAHRLVRTQVTKINTFTSEHISGMKLIQIFGREDYKYNEFEQNSNRLYKANFREMMVFAIFRPFMYFTSMLGLVIVLGIGGNDVLNGTISVGLLFIFAQYIGQFFEPIQELAEQFGTMQSAMAASEKIFTLLDEKPLIVNSDNPVSVPDLGGSIEFKNVWFAYENEDWILRDVSFTINNGQRVAFVGATGAGKSSILNLIGRYYDVQKGEILIDGVNIKDVPTDALRRCIGQVQQDVFIFTGDIRSNIRLRNNEISDSDIQDAATHVNAAQFIEKLPDNYGQHVTERGSTLSAGQRQLLSFARTLAFKPRILVLDEATANIDTETEGLIQNALEKLMENRTSIIVAHRLSTIQHADNIIVMHKGKIRESGTHQELLSKNGRYKMLYELQK